MQQIMAHCFLAVKSKLECKLGYFDLIGCDFLIDDNFKVPWGHPRAVGPGGQVQGAGASVPSLTTRQALGWTLQSDHPKPRGRGRPSSFPPPAAGQPPRPDPSGLSPLGKYGG